MFDIRLNLLLLFFLFIMGENFAVAEQQNKVNNVVVLKDKGSVNNKIIPIEENIKEKKPLYPKDIQDIINKGKIVVAMYHIDTPPFYYVDDKGNLAGVDVELIKGFAKLLNVDIEFNRESKFLNSTLDKVLNNEADLAITKLSITFSRVKRALFTKPYINLHQALLINRLLLAKQLKGRSREETIQNLRGKIGVIAKSSYVKYAKQRFKYAEVVGYKTWLDAVDAVLKGEVIAAYRDEAEIKKIIRDRPDTALKLLSVVLKDAKDPKGIAVAANKRHLKTLLDFYIDSLELNLTADKVLNEYELVVNSIKTRTK